MNQYGILGRYLPEFGRIVGQMQHDLFHVYTVDQHILMVMRNLRRFTMPEFAHEFPLCSELMSGFERRWLLYVAALYHDIAKGRGGDHSELGAEDVRGVLQEDMASAEGGQRPGRSSWSSATSPCRTWRRSRTSTTRRWCRPSPSWSAPSAAWWRSTSSPWPTCAAPARRCGTPGKASCSRTCSAPRAACSPASRWRATPRSPRSRPRPARLLRLYALSDASRTSSGRASTPPTSCATTRRRSPGRRATCTTASTPTSRWSRRASRRSARACR